MNTIPSTTAGEELPAELLSAAVQRGVHVLGVPVHPADPAASKADNLLPATP
jgi:hypothetical protein